MTDKGMEAFFGVFGRGMRGHYPPWHKQGRAWSAWIGEDRQWLNATYCCNWVSSPPGLWAAANQ